MLDFIDFALKWAVAPLLAAIWHLDRKINGQDLKHMEHRAAIEVMKARLDAQTAASAAVTYPPLPQRLPTMKPGEFLATTNEI